MSEALADLHRWLRRNRLPDQVAWENFYLLPLVPLVLNDPKHYFEERNRLFAEGKRYQEP